jgi:hypothetical protein
VNKNFLTKFNSVPCDISNKTKYAGEFAKGHFHGKGVLIGKIKVKDQRRRRREDESLVDLLFVAQIYSEREWEEGHG